MGVLPYGRTVPDSGDESVSAWMPEIAANTALDDAHIHDGITSALINILNIAKTEQTLNNGIFPAGDWVLVGNSIYRQLVTMPAGFTYNNNFMRFYVDDPGDASGYDQDEVFLRTTRDGASSYYVYINDPTLGLKVRYI